ncbi:MAG: 50S ribosomal protein L11 methyltransferase [Chitinivibrionales bacterium]
MNQTWCLSVELFGQQSELAVGLCIQQGMMGCEELEKGDRTLLRCHFGSRKDAQNALGLLQQKLSVSSFDISAVQQQDWNAKWRESMQPARLTDSVWVSPVWLPPPKQDDHLWIKIEPKMAFGTGHHETTRLAARAITELDSLSGARLIDIGTGSGVLCFVGGLGGAQLSVGVEIDPCCLENIAENKEANATGGKTEFIIGTVDALACERNFDIVVMNMIRTHSEPLLERCYRFLRPGGQLIWSGILTEESEEVIASANQHRFTLHHQSSENEWWCGVFSPLTSSM